MTDRRCLMSRSPSFVVATDTMIACSCIFSMRAARNLVSCCDSNLHTNRSDQIRSDQTRTDQIRSDQIRSDQIRSDQTRLN